MTIQLSDNFSYKKLLRFTLPSIAMMIFTSIYGVIDGLFVSNFVGKQPFAAINLIWPVSMLLGAFGFMIGTGGSALVAKMLGEKKQQLANQTFSMLIFLSIAIGALISVLGFAFVRPISVAIGAEGETLNYCITYGRILLLATVAFVLQCEFQSFLVVAEKPQLGLAVTAAAGVTNIVLDALFIAVLKWGLVGAALATTLSQAVGAVIPLVYFALNKNSPLRLLKAGFNFKAVLQTCFNGSSEMMTNLSMSVVNILYNFQLMRLSGENGVAAYGVIMYVNFIFVSIFIGYSIGSAPVISYHYGAQNLDELKSLFKKSVVIISAFSAAMLFSAVLLAKPLSAVFVGYDKTLFDITARGLTIYSISFLFTGFNIFGSSFFTALNNGLVSAAISFLRTLVFQIISVLLLPVLFGLDGVWIAIIAAEGLSLIVTIAFIKRLRPVYHY